MKLKLLILVTTTFLFASSCSTMYVPALYHQDIAYQPKPTSFDIAKTAGYASGGLNNYMSLNGDFITSGQINMSVAHRFGNINIAYGGFGVLGNYQPSDSKSHGIDPDPSHRFDDKSFGAVGGRFSANAFITSNNMDFRFIGVEAAYSHEFGDYANFRQRLGNLRGFTVVDPRTDLYTIGLTSEVVFHSAKNPDVQSAIRGFMGFTVNHKEQSDIYYNTKNSGYFHDIPFPGIIFFPKISYFVSLKRYFATAEIGDNFNLFLRFGYKF